MRYPLPWFPLSDDPSRCSCRTKPDCHPYRSSRAVYRFGRSGSSGFVGGFRLLHWSSYVPVPKVRSCRAKFLLYVFFEDFRFNQLVMQVVEIVLHFVVGEFSVDEVAEVVVVIGRAVVGFQAVVRDGRAIVVGQDIVRGVEVACTFSGNPKRLRSFEQKPRAYRTHPTSGLEVSCGLRLA